ncbi:hypothetical protein EXM52_09285 [Clostridium botulinum]|nr:hypothetical protein [Clostridium botulinum]NFB54038.1 hypothetical protein [Clostridium botulinum]NFB55539.1 hypothetical protein [Clostridium botulinum]NFB61839.1 hypothetical protein [Clostridium botulinum]NFC87973.1 hypothetical protein [Clostridium botulinum]
MYYLLLVFINEKILKIVATYINYNFMFNKDMLFRIYLV